MAEEFPRSDPSASPEAPAQSAPARKGMVVVYHGEGEGKEAAALGVLFRAHGRGLPVRYVNFTPPSDPPTSDDVALERLGIPSNHMARNDAEAARELWGKAVRHMSIVQDGVLVISGLFEAAEQGWLSTSEVLSALAEKGDLLHVILIGRSAPGEFVEIADLVSHMRAVKTRVHDDPVPGIDA